MTMDLGGDDRIPGAPEGVWARLNAREVLKTSIGGGPPVRRETDGVRVRRPRQGDWGLRVVGSLFGLAAWVVGLYSLLGGGETMSELSRERALGYGVVALVVGTVAIVGSLAVRDVRALWYCTPRRWRLFRDRD